MYVKGAKKVDKRGTWQQQGQKNRRGAAPGGPLLQGHLGRVMRW